MVVPKLQCVQRWTGRAIGLDLHRDFCEIAICEEGQTYGAGRVAMTPDGIEALADSLLPTDRVVMEVSSAAWEVARRLEGRCQRMVVVSPGDTGISQARAKTDRLDARTLAKLLWTGELEAVWVPPEWIGRMRRRLHRREQLVRDCSRAKNEIHAVLMRRLKGRPPVSDLFGVKGRNWLRGLQLPLEEAETVEAGLRHIEFLDCEIEQVERDSRMRVGRPELDSTSTTGTPPWLARKTPVETHRTTRPSPTSTSVYCTGPGSTGPTIACPLRSALSPSIMNPGLAAEMPITSASGNTAASASCRFG